MKDERPNDPGRLPSCRDLENFRPRVEASRVVWFDFAQNPAHPFARSTSLCPVRGERSTYFGLDRALGMPCDTRSRDQRCVRPTSAFHDFEYEHPHLVGSFRTVSRLATRADEGNMAIHGAKLASAGPDESGAGVVFPITIRRNRTSDAPVALTFARASIHGAHARAKAEIASTARSVKSERLSRSRTPSLGRYPSRAFTSPAA